MNRSITRWTLVGAILLAGPALATATTIDLDFKGGSAVDYVKAVRAATGEVNVMLTPDLELVRMQPVELRRVSARAALELVQGEYEIGPGRETLAVRLQTFASPGGDQLDVYRLDAHRVGARRAPLTSRVWSLAEMTSRGTAPADVLTAVEAALALYGESYPEATLRFHDATGLLIARAHPEQVETIHEVLVELAERGPGARAEEVEAEAETRIAALEAELHEYTQGVEMMRRELIEWRTRADVLQREIESLQGERANMREEMRRTAVEREVETARLRMEINALQQQRDRD